MAMTMDLPCSTEDTQANYVAGEQSTAAAEAEQLLTDGDSQEVDGEQREITIILAKDVDVDDATMSFHGKKGETLTAMIDADGCVLLPLMCKEGGDGELYLEAEEFEVVTLSTSQASEAAPEQSAEATSEPAAEPQPTVAEVAPPETNTASGETKPPASETAEPQKPAAPQFRKLTPREEYLHEKAALEEQLGGLMMELADLKEQAKQTKKEAEVVTEKLANLIRGWEYNPGGPALEPVPTVKEMASTMAGIGTDATTATSQPQTEAEMRAKLAAAGEATVSQASQVVARDEAAEEERYKQVLKAAKIEELGLPPKVTEKLQEAGAGNIWDLEQLRSEISQHRAKWPKGIGPGKVTDIEDALMQWMSRNQSTWESSQKEEAAEPVSQPRPRTQEEIDAKNAELAAKHEPQAESVPFEPTTEPTEQPAPAQSIDDLLSSL